MSIQGIAEYPFKQGQVSQYLVVKRYAGYSRILLLFHH